MTMRERVIIGAVCLTIGIGAAALWMAMNRPDAPAEPLPQQTAEAPPTLEPAPEPAAAPLPVPVPADESTDAGEEPAPESGGAAIAGRVTDQRTGAPVPGVTVRAIDSAQSGMEAAFGRGAKDATTGDDGAYRIPGLNPDNYRVTVEGRAAGYLFAQDQARLVDVAEDAVVDAVDFTLVPGGRIFGAVHGEDGKPVAGARVTVTPGDGLQLDPASLERMAYAMNREWRVETGEDGAYARTGVDFDADFTVRAEADGYADAVSAKVRIPSGQSEALVNLALTRGSAVSGVARYENGDPAAALELTMMPGAGGFIPMSGRPKQTRTAENGAFTFENVTAGAYVIRNMDRFNPLEMSAAPRIEVDGRSDLTGLDVVLPDPAESNAIRGVVVAYDGSPVEGAKVTLEGRMGRGAETAVTGPDGRFAFGDVQGFLFGVKAEFETARASASRIQPGADVTLTLAEPARIEGVVVSASGEPVADCTVTLANAGAEDHPAASVFAAIGAMAGRRGDSEKTDAEGRFVFDEVDPGAYIVEAALRGSGEAESEPVDIAEGQSRTGLRLVLEVGVRVAGSVRDPAGAPVAGASVSLISTAPGGDESMTVMAGLVPGMNAGVSGRTNEAGEFELLDIAPGAYTLTAQHTAFARATVPGVEVTKGRDVTGLAVRLAEGSKVSGRIARDGQPRGGVVVNLMGENGSFMAFTDANGEFNLDHVPQGTYMATAVDMQNMAAEGMAGMDQTQRVVDIEDGKPAEIDFSPLPGSVPVTGQLTTPVQGMTVATLRREGGMSPLEVQQGSLRDQMALAQNLVGTAMVGPDGSFAFNDVPPGTYILDVISMNVDMSNMEALMNIDPTTLPHTEQVVTVTENGLHIEAALPGTATPALP